MALFLTKEERLGHFGIHKGLYEFLRDDPVYQESEQQAKNQQNNVHDGRYCGVSRHVLLCLRVSFSLLFSSCLYSGACLCNQCVYNVFMLLERQMRGVATCDAFLLFHSAANGSLSVA